MLLDKKKKKHATLNMYHLCYTKYFFITSFQNVSHSITTNNFFSRKSWYLQRSYRDFSEMTDDYLMDLDLSTYCTHYQ